MTTKLIVMANEIPAIDQPVSFDMGSANTASENMAPTATQPMRPPSATMTQRYGYSLMTSRHLALHGNTDLHGRRRIARIERLVIALEQRPARYLQIVGSRQQLVEYLPE